MTIGKYISWTKVDDGKIAVVNSKSKKCILLEGSSIMVWNLLLEANSIDEVKYKCSKMYKGDTEEIHKDIEELLCLLIDYQIIEV